MHEVGSLHLGEIILVETKGKLIVNAITQDNYGRDPNIRYVSYDAVADCFSSLQKFLDKKLHLLRDGCRAYDRCWSWKWRLEYLVFNHQ